MAMSEIEKQIRQCYADNPGISGVEIRRKLGQEGNPQFWLTLSQVQEKMRGFRSSLNGKRNDGWWRTADHFSSK